MEVFHVPGLLSALMMVVIQPALSLSYKVFLSLRSCPRCISIWGRRPIDWHKLMTGCQKLTMTFGSTSLEDVVRSEWEINTNHWTSGYLNFNVKVINYIIHSYFKVNQRSYHLHLTSIFKACNWSSVSIR